MTIFGRVGDYARRHAFTLGAGVVCMVVCWWMITVGTGEVVAPTGFGGFYDGQAESLLHGHWDVTPQAISGEAFIVQGKYYGYFGFVPALPRMVLNTLFPGHVGEWTRLLMLFWVASIIIATMVFMDLLAFPFRPFVVAIAVLGSTVIFLCSYAFTYHEAVLTSSALALWAYLFFFLYVRRPRIRFLAAGCLLSFLAFFSRLTVGAGPMIAGAALLAMLVFRRYAQSRGSRLANRIRDLIDTWKWPNPPTVGKHAVFLMAFLLVSAVTYVSINHAKFGTWLNPAPYQYNIQYDAARLARIDGSISHLANVPFSVAAYFGPGRIDFRESFPWILLTSEGPGTGSTAKIDVIEGYSSVTAAMPALFLLAAIGLVTTLWRWHDAQRIALLLLGAALAAGCLTLTVAFVTYRYVHDFYPFLLISALFGTRAISFIRRKHVRRGLKALLIAAGIWSIAANMAFALVFQRERTWPERAERFSFLHFRANVDSLVVGGVPTPIPYRIGDPVDSLRVGQLLISQNPPSTYRYNGQSWNHISGTPLHRFDLRVKFRPGAPGVTETLWSAGRTGKGDAIYISYWDTMKLEFCLEQSGEKKICAYPVEIQPGLEYRLNIDADRLNEHLRVSLDGATVLDSPAEFAVWSDADVLLGRDLKPNPRRSEFSGEIIAEKR